jgi:hypothetical protein
MIEEEVRRNAKGRCAKEEDTEICASRHLLYMCVKQEKNFRGAVFTWEDMVVERGERNVWRRKAPSCVR